jgi:hypothetical protein
MAGADLEAAEAEREAAGGGGSSQWGCASEVERGTPEELQCNVGQEKSSHIKRGLRTRPLLMSWLSVKWLFRTRLSPFRSVHLFLGGHFEKGLSGSVFDGEVPGEQFVDLVDWMVGDSVQDLSEIAFRVQSVDFCRPDERIDGGSPFATASVITLKPAIRYQFKTGHSGWPET